MLRLIFLLPEPRKMTFAKQSNVKGSGEERRGLITNWRPRVCDVTADVLHWLPNKTVLLSNDCPSVKIPFLYTGIY